MVALAAGAALGGLIGSTNHTVTGHTTATSSSALTASQIAAQVDPGLVDINTTLGYQQEQAAGTGIVLTSNGVILTNNHVIDGATSISVTDIGNGKTYTASVVGYDRTKDIAVLQLHNASGLQTASLGDPRRVGGRERGRRRQRRRHRRDTQRRRRHGHRAQPVDHGQRRR